MKVSKRLTSTRSSSNDPLSEVRIHTVVRFRGLAVLLMSESLHQDCHDLFADLALRRLEA